MINEIINAIYRSNAIAHLLVLLV